MAIFKNTEKLPTFVKKNALAVMEELLKLHNENIVSIYFYGSALGENFMPGVSSITSVVVFRKLDCVVLRASLRVIDKGIRMKVAAPLFLTPEHITSSIDTFPIEFLEMRENNVIVYGEDLLGPLSIDSLHIRFVCEEQLKGKLIRIRQGYLEIGLRKKGIEALIKESLDSLLPVFKGLLRLKSINPPAEADRVFGLLSENFGIDSNVFLAILKDEKNDEKILGEDISIFLAKYIKQIEKLADISDKL